jgi:hypothetical protein
VGSKGAAAVKVVEEAQWSWMLLAEGAEMYLSVVCGTAAVYEIEFALNQDEIEGYAREGKAFLERLAGRVVGMPGTFHGRQIPDFHDRPGVDEAIAAWRKIADAAKAKD